MALSRTGMCCGSAAMLLYGMRTNVVLVGATSLTLASRQLRLAGLWHCQYSTKAKQSLSRRVLKRLKRANEKYEHFLNQTHPTPYFINGMSTPPGFRLLFRDVKEIQRIKAKNLSFQQLPYRDMETLRQFRRDIVKAAPLVLISIPPFANYLVFVLMYLFPRQLLIRHFWTPQQQLEFQQIYHRQRAQQCPAILGRLAREVPCVTNKPLQSQLLHLCNKVQSGAHPSVSEIQAVRRLFAGPPLGMNRLDAEHMRLLCSQLFLTPRLPAVLIRHRLWDHASKLLHLDRALSMLGLHQLTDPELRQACYLRGLDSTCLSTNECREWLYQWLQLTTHLKVSEASLLLHSMVLLSINYPRGAGR
uniref:LETM1 domain containing 1 n=1 Tax=Lepisosteus oculatus TaxID=7918 RepID=W5MAB4_LEPOC